MKLLIVILLVSSVGFAKEKPVYAIGKPIAKWFNKPFPKGLEVTIIENVAKFEYKEADGNCVQIIWFNNKGIITDFKEDGTSVHCTKTSALHEKNRGLAGALQ